MHGTQRQHRSRGFKSESSRTRTGYAMSIVAATAMVFAGMFAALASTPAGAASVTMSVNPLQEFTDTGVLLTAGESVSVSATGAVQIRSGGTSETPAGEGTVSADGTVCSSTGTSGPVFPLPNQACWSLIGQVGSGVIFEVGTHLSFTAPNSGEFYLGINDNVLGDNSGSWSATITVPDAGPVISPGVSPAPAAATSASGAVVTFATPTASDAGGSVPVGCTPASGTTFPIGSTTVTCTATNPADSPSSAQTSLTVKVIDTSLAITPGADPAPAAATSASGAVVTFVPPTASDFSGPVPVVCAPAAGSTFPIGSTTVNCSATAAADYPSSKSTTLTVDVIDASLTITPGVNPPQVLAASPNVGAPVTFTIPTASDFSGPVPVLCDRPSGSMFPVGGTKVTCTATKNSDVPSTAQTSLNAVVYLPATVPGAPTIGSASAGDTSASVSFDPPIYDGSDPISSYTVSCASSDGGASGSATGPYSPITVTGLSNTKTYQCSVAATNINGTGPPSGPSNTFSSGAVTVTCTNQQTCHATTSTPTSSTNPQGTVQVSGTPSAPIGTVSVSISPAALNCAGLPAGTAAVTDLTDTGFPSSNNLTVTMTQFAIATGPGRVCYSSTIPFLSISNPTTPKAGTALLLFCSQVANKAPCQISSNQTSSSVIVKVLVAGGDPLMKVVVPKGRLLWPSTFPTGRVGTPYSGHLQSTGGKAPVHWKVATGKLPPGLTLNTSTGAITGKPTTKGAFASVVHATDSSSPPQVANISVSITIK
jgi:hypothetical protein